MSKGVIEIEYLEDEHDCELCGFSYSRGYKVFLNGEVLFVLEPIAHCYNEKNYDEEDLLVKTLETLGYRVNEYS